MAIFFLQISSLSRNQGRRATAAAAYRAGEKIRDERSGDLHNHAGRRDVLHKEILLPAAIAAQAPAWARDRAQLWNAAERAESRRTARVAREWQVNLPSELPAENRLQLARAFSQEIADRYGIAVDLAVHAPRPEGDPRNFHAHILGTTRELTARGLGAKAGIDMSSAERVRRGLPAVPQEYTTIRERWAMLTNAALEAAHVDARVDHRSLAAQGIDREPQPRLPMALVQMERSGRHSAVAERVRAEYRARIARRVQAADAAAPQMLPQPRTLEEIRRAAREDWRRARMNLQSGSSAERGTLRSDRSLDDDYTP